MDWGLIISIVGVASGVILGWLGKSKSVKDEIKTEASVDATLKTDMDYIKRGVDEVRLEQKDQGRRFDALSERVTRVEENSRSAHKRIDRVEAQISKGG